MINKIVQLEELRNISVKLKAEGKKIVHCHGVFDLLHPGHIKHFESAKKLGDILIVTITEDKYVNKGPDRPIFNEILRAETLSAIQIINFVAINNSPLANNAIEVIKPNFYVKGPDYKKEKDDITGGITQERKMVEQYGGKLVITDDIQFSSTKIINRHFDKASDELKKFLKQTREKTSFVKIKENFETISKMKVLVIGDIILDEYIFVEPLGKASKSATITAKKMSGELYAGGVLAVANHISNFVNEVKLITVHGNNFGNNYYDFVKSKLNKNIVFASQYVDDRPSVLKRRYVDSIFKHKLFEIIEIEDTPLPETIKKCIYSELESAHKNFDLIVVSDFGHGLIDNDIIQCIINSDIFLSVNAQTNSANKGFNLLTKYPHCDYFSIDENEARLATHEKYSNIEILMDNLLMKTNAKLASITLGVKGSLVGDINKKCIAPVLSSEVLDTIGAGDAYLSITSLLAKNGNSPHEIAFVGNAVGAMAVKILGNKSYIEKIPLLKYLKTLLT